jgi:hypothetical protein
MAELPQFGSSVALARTAKLGVGAGATGRLTKGAPTSNAAKSKLTTKLRATAAAAGAVAGGSAAASSVVVRGRARRATGRRGRLPASLARGPSGKRERLGGGDDFPLNGWCDSHRSRAPLSPPLPPPPRSVRPS